ncbi:hypothetical protein H5410_023726 [Solanum commersonii]|uniref:MRN complex-interacting protein N-terminal domain-containing protein n=1 Tax=Solanum commersonii TaxID=4109 RepID=A0A9J5ZIR6_SOLCO|nr:hypothetical protein H5410_023726 [Solanum commersonii]
MPTVFIAVQCCECSTMQVKQQKKSSNKWTCVVCNQKQSVRKVFAQGYKAKEIRLFVQSFNMSRQFTDQLPVIDREEIETLAIEEQNQSHGSLKRKDWTEYLDPEEDAIENDEISGDIMEPKIVTELPKELFRRPRLNNYSAVAGNFKPVFSKRNARKQSISQGYRNAQNTDVERSKHQATMASVISKWGDDRTAPLDMSVQPAADSVCKLNEGINLYDNDNYRNGDLGYGKSVQRSQPKTANKVSKWTEYITEDADDCLSHFASGRGFTSELNEDINRYDHDNYINGEGNHGYSKSEQRSHPKTANKVSKWTEYKTEDEDDCHSQFASGRGSTSDVNKWSGNTFETSLKDQRLDDEEIHPDFL